MAVKIFLIGMAALLSFTGRAQTSLGDPLDGLEQLKPFQSRRASSSDPNWRNGNADARPIAPHGVLTLAELSGPGKIVHFWCTIAHSDPYYPRMMVLRIYWDGEEHPSVECPIGDFFGMGHGIDKPFDSLPVRVTSDGRGRNCYWPMPFRKSARVTVSNDSDQPCGAFYYYIDWQQWPSLPADTAYFHAMYRQEFPCVMGRNYLIADLQGRGHYVGTVQSVMLVSDGWYGEGDDFFFIDGEKEPSLRGTGTEDYFCDGWGFREQAGLFYGAPLWEGFSAGDRGSAYRWHIPDPVAFTNSLRVEIEHKGSQTFPDGTSSGFIERDDMMSSVAYWYQIEPHKPWPPLPPASQRMPFHDHSLIKGYEKVGAARHSDASVVVQPIGGAVDGKQLWFRPTQDGAWLEIPFHTGQPVAANLMLKLVHSWDYGIYRVKLDQRELGQLDLYSPSVSGPIEHKFGLQQLPAGDHVLRFEGVGKAPESKGYYLGFDSLAMRAPVYSRPPTEDLRQLQKPREE